MPGSDELPLSFGRETFGADPTGYHAARPACFSLARCRVRSGQGPRGAALRPGGAVALIWNVFGDPQRHDAFHEATTSLFAGRAIRAGSAGQAPHALQSDARRDDFRAAGLVPDDREYVAWTLVLDPDHVRRLYATFSNVTALPPDDRVKLLDALVETATTTFGGRVERNMVTAIHTAHRRV